MTVISPPVAARSTGRWWLFWLLAAAVITVAGLIAVEGQFSVEAIRLIVRVTAQMSLGLFCAAFAAAALARRWPSVLTLFLRRYRRQLGVSFAFSHAVHAAALVTFARIAPAQFHEAADAAMFIFGGLAYFFIIAMASTSFDRTAAWLGPRRWRLLHTLGAYDIWLTFLVAEGKRAVQGPGYWPYVALLVVVMALRLADRFGRPRAVHVLLEA